MSRKIGKANRSLFDGFRSNMDETKRKESKAGDTESRTKTVLEHRNARISGVKERARQHTILMRVDPAKCRMWKRHNRRYDLLNEQNCSDLIEGFKAQGGQEFPAVVREIQGDDEHIYEVIAGARRHWTAGFLGEKFLIEVRNLADEEALRLSDIENRDRKDISDYERALDYKDAMKRYYKTQKLMARSLEVGEVWLSRYLYLAELPQEIVDVYASVTDLRESHARDLKPFLDKPSTRQKMITRAVELQGRGLSGPEVVKALIATVRVPTKKKNSLLREFKRPSGEKMLSVSRKGRVDLNIVVAGKSGASKEELLEAFSQALDDHYPDEAF